MYKPNKQFTQFYEGLITVPLKLATVKYVVNEIRAKLPYTINTDITLSYKIPTLL